MAITIHQSSSLNSLAWNPQDYVLSSTLSDADKFKYAAKITYDLVTITAVTPYTATGTVQTKLTLASNPFKKGESVYIEDNGNYVITKSDISSNFIIIAETPDNLDITAASTQVMHQLSYRFDKNVNTDLGHKDFSNALINFVDGEMRNTNDLYWSDEVLFRYNVVLGEESKVEFNFEDNFFYSGSVGFYNSTLGAADTASLGINIGDKIQIQQELTEWSYDDNYFYSGAVAFTGSADHYFDDGATIFISGQVTNPSYNGYTQVAATGSAGSLLVTDLSWLASSPVEPGSIYGYPVPAYNTTATVRNIIVDGTYGIIIITDLSWVKATPVIPGKINLATSTVKRTYDTPLSTQLTSVGGYDKSRVYSTSPELVHIDDTIASTQKVSSIIAFKDNYKHRIESNAKSWILAKPALHSDSSLNSTEIQISASFKQNGSLIGTGSFNTGTPLTFIYDQINASTGYYGVYIPVGLEQLNTSADFSHNVGSIDNVTEYDIEITNGSATVDTITFQINTDCSPGYEIYNIIFKDSLGSYIAIPFIYKSVEGIEVESDSFYKQPGSLNGTTNTYDRSTLDRGRTKIYARQTEKVKLTSGWVKDAENELIKDLMSSTDIYIQTPDNNVYSADILNNNIDLGKVENTAVYNYSFDFVYSVDTIKH